ncbi:indole-3-glycerol phosphate synthase TrpC [Lentiprolixibacter aurantiacus]|uniref:Indole-3-glycerol phosphate synthase n=1 Tax=Lentiprolixibacter aurantiacus TaxID=2993939 RepID=A0AAE3SNL6_9FLAO|nr:indole-3-glycerol phosphate synthase TrpC [Lentiprolixibacter aurantiacus]MCX2719311.1 indole-3-glycerol phosphate synthase TrpC [Lentiprolixibacter aurantiacus]
MDILEKIVADKRREVALKKQLISTSSLENYPLFERESPSLSANLRQARAGIIAEHKRRSPSKSVINNGLDVYKVAIGYQKAGASGMSVLTDGKYFGGSLDDLLLARSVVDLPLLRKDFTVDEYQIIEAKAYGADAILLIAAVLKPAEIRTFSELAINLGLEVLLEVHNLEELNNSLVPGIQMLGVNNRNLKTFEVDLETSRQLSGHIPDSMVKVSESGISNTDAILNLQGFGYQGFLVGEHFMKSGDPGKSAEEFIQNIRG